LEDLNVDTINTAHPKVLPKPATRLGRIPPYPFAVLNQKTAELSAQGIRVINMDVGSPDLPPPDHVIDALSDSAHAVDNHGYAGYKGIPQFRNAVAAYYQRRFNVMLDPDTQVLPLLGSKEGIVKLALTYLDDGDRVLVPDIGYPAYSLGAWISGAAVEWVPLRKSNGYMLDLEELHGHVSDYTKLIWVNYPNNPTGACVDLSYYQALSDFCRTHQLLLASDNPYCDVTFDGYIAPSLLQAEGALESAVEFISFSKTFNMAGWRLGAAVGSAEVIKNMVTMKSNFDSGHFRAVYDAGIDALTNIAPDWITQRNQVYQRRRDTIIERLERIGLRGSTPRGSLYIWAEVTDPTLDGEAYAELALQHAHVSLAPGSFYGPGGTRFVRMSLCAPDALTIQALDQLEAWYTSR
jgi:LL-diaminopimelate aminotransferase